MCVQTATEYQGLTWNYFSIGMDARTVYSFDRLRAKKPHLAPGGNINKCAPAPASSLCTARSDAGMH